MFRYAQIDITTGRCIGVSFLSGEIEAEHMIPLTDEDEVNPNDTFDNGSWIPTPPPDPVPAGESPAEKMARLETENTDLNLQVIDLWENAIAQDEAKQQIEASNADLNLQIIDLWETLYSQGVIV